MGGGACGRKAVFWAEVSGYPSVRAALVSGGTLLGVVFLALLAIRSFGDVLLEGIALLVGVTVVASWAWFFAAGPLRVVVEPGKIRVGWSIFPRVISARIVTNARTSVDFFRRRYLQLTLSDGEVLDITPALASHRTRVLARCVALLGTRGDVPRTMQSGEPYNTLLDVLASPDDRVLARLRALGDGVLDGTRGTRVPREMLFLHVEADDAPERTRAAAGVALLGAEATSADRARLRAVSESLAPGTLRSAIEAALANRGLIVINALALDAAPSDFTSQAR